MDHSSRELFETIEELSFQEALDSVLHNCAQELALSFGDFSQNYDELERSLAAVDAWITAEGISAQDRIVLMMPNSPDLIWLTLGLLRRGIVFSPFDLRLSPDVHMLQLEAFQPSRILFRPEEEERVAEVQAASSFTFHLTEIDFKSWQNPENLPQHADAREVAIESVPQDYPVLYYPRLTRDESYIFAGFTLQNLSSTVSLTRQVFCLHRGDVVLCHMANGHYLALGSMILPALLSGGHLLLLDRTWNNDVVLDAIQTHNPKLMVHYRKYFWLLERAAHVRLEKGQSIGTIQHAVINADSPAIPFRADFEELFHGHLLAGFASPLACSFLSLELPWLSQKEGYVGKAMPGVEFLILDESGQERQRGRWGELAFRSPGMSNFCLPEGGTGSEKHESGFLMSQQMAMESSGGFLALADEVFDVIKISGFKISPLEIEEPILALDGIADVAAVNAPRDSHPDQVRLFVVPEEGSDWTPHGLKEHCESLFQPYMTPSVVEFIDAIPYDDEEFKLRKELKARYPYVESWRTS